MVTEVELEKYKQEVRSWLPCSRKMKSQIMNQLEESLTNFLKQNTQANLHQIQKHFGSPEEIASTYVENMGANVLLRDLRINRRIMCIVSGMIAVVLAIWLLVVGWGVVKELKDDAGTYNIGPVVEVDR